MRPFQKRITFFIIMACALVWSQAAVTAEESKNFFSWNSNFIKKSTTPKAKGIPANPPKKKIKGIPTQPSQKADAELTEDEKRTIQAMSAQAGQSDGDPSHTGMVKRPVFLQAHRVPRAPQLPKLFAIPKNPNLHAVRIPSPPTPFSGNSAANSGVPANPDPNS